MNRLACVDVPALPLQILLRRHPEWREEPVAVVAEDKAQTQVRWANRRAITLGVRPGMRQTAAVACCPALRIGHVRSSEVEGEVSRLAERLHRWSPQVESASTLRPFVSGCGAAGAFWLRASGLAGLFGPLSKWAEALRRDLAEDGFQASVAVGFTRFGAFAAARAVFGQQILESPAEEKSAAAKAPLVRFGLPGKALVGLEKLGIRSLGDLLRVSGKGLGSRFGNEVSEFHRLASGETEAHSSRLFRPEAPVERRIFFEPAETDGERLLFHAKRLLDQILADLGERGLALTELGYAIELEDGRPVSGSVLPALPSEDGVRLLSLLRLRLKADSPESQTAGRENPERRPERRMTGSVLRARGGPFVSEPRSLYENPSGTSGTAQFRRDRKKASEALAQVQAEFGEDSLVRVETRDAHLPRGRYCCRPISPARAVGHRFPAGNFPEARPPAPPTGSGSAAGREPAGRRTGPPPTPLSAAPARVFPERSHLGSCLVRRIYEQPLVLPHRGPGEPDGWLLRGIEHGPVRSFAGPYRISGGWWRLLSGRPITRDYFFVRLKRGDVCWVFFDRERRSWFLEGRVE